jgi:hypothetical protein
MTAMELLNKPSSWTQGNLAITKDGVPCNPCSPSAVSWCLMGALDKCYSDPIDRDAARNKIHTEIGEDIPLLEWNDDMLRTFDHIHFLLKEVRI